MKEICESLRLILGKAEFAMKIRSAVLVFVEKRKIFKACF